MDRKSLAPRPDWLTTVQQQGLIYAYSEKFAEGAEYWNDGAVFELSEAESDKLNLTTEAMMNMIYDTVDDIIASGRVYDLLEGIFPRNFIAHMVKQYTKVGRGADQWGRMDFSFDMENQPRFFEYNADTPVTVLEFSYIQWEWLQDRYKDGTYDPEIIDQNNEIYTNLVEMFKKYKGKKMMFTCLREQINAVLEYETTCLYLAEVASHAGVKAFFRFVDDLVIDQYTGQIVDEQHGVPDAIFKLYPTEWFLNDLIQQKCEDPVKFFEANNFIEQPYKLLMGGKYLLPELYRLFGETNGLIKAWHTREECIDKKVVAKSYYGRIGFQVEVLEPGQQTTLEDRVIYQEYVETQRYGDDNCKVTIGSFVIGGVASGIGIRSQTADVTTDNCYAVPHVVYKD